MRLMDRYLLTCVLSPVLYALGGFMAIFVLFDLTETAGRLLGPGGGLWVLFRFYWTQVPYLLLLFLPACLLLGTIFALGRLSRTNELTAMMNAGVGLPRLLAPVIALGILASAGLSFLSYDLATELEVRKSQILNELTGVTQQRPSLRAHLFRNRDAHRTWLIEELPLDSNTMRGLEITQQNADGSLAWKIYARRGEFDPLTREWRFFDVKLVQYRPDGVAIRQRTLPLHRELEWSETAWQLVSSAYRARYLGSVQIHRYLQENAGFPDPQLAPFRTYAAYRLAQPWSCLIAILIAAPLGVVRGRRGMIGNLGLALVLFFAHFMLTTVFLALGEGSRVPPWIAAWGPNLLIGGIALLLLWWRTGNHEWHWRLSRGRDAPLLTEATG